MSTPAPRVHESGDLTPAPRAPRSRAVRRIVVREKIRTFKELTGITGTLANPSKMPGYAWALPALEACPTGTLLASVPGSTCASCYALKGRFIIDNVKASHADKLAKIRAWLDSEDPADEDRWVAAMIELIGRRVSRDNPWFRIHVSGDFFDVRYFLAWVRICKALPWVNFWAPTREVRYAKLAARVAPDNMMVRYSAPMIDAFPEMPGLPVSYVSDQETAPGNTCPAPRQDGKCQDCRACWSRDVKSVTYHVH